MENVRLQPCAPDLVLAAAFVPTSANVRATATTTVEPEAHLHPL